MLGQNKQFPDDTLKDLSAQPTGEMMWTELTSISNTELAQSYKYTSPSGTLSSCVKVLVYIVPLAPGQISFHH